MARGLTEPVTVTVIVEFGRGRRWCLDLVDAATFERVVDLARPYWAEDERTWPVAHLEQDGRRVALAQLDTFGALQCHAWTRDSEHLEHGAALLHIAGRTDA